MRSNQRDAYNRASRLDRDECTALLEHVGIQVYDSEPIDVLRDAVQANIADGTIDPNDVP